MNFPLTKIRTSHAITIRTANKTIGQIQHWAPSQARAVNPVYEIDAVGKGVPRENAIGVASNLTIQVARYDLYKSKMEEIWGTPYAFFMLTDQFNPLDIEERWVKYNDEHIQAPVPWKHAIVPTWGKDIGAKLLTDWGLEEDVTEGIDAGEGEITVEKLWYSGCYFSQLGRNLQAEGDRIVMVNATINYVKVRSL